MFKSFDSAKIVQIALTLLLIGSTFYPAFAMQLALHNSIAYAIARGTGASFKQLLPFLFFPMLRMLNATLYRISKKFFHHTFTDNLFHKRAFFHKLLGTALLFLAGTHIIAHGIAQTVAWLAIESITGLTMMSLIALPIAGMSYLYSSNYFKNNPQLKKSYHGSFLIPHQIGWWGLIAVFGFHTLDLRLLSWSAGIFSLFSFDRLWEWTKSHDVIVNKIEHIHTKMIMIEMEKPKDYVYQTGEKAYLAYPPKSAFTNRLHPFTIASSADEKVLRFVISDAGKWSHHLIQHLQKNDKVRISPAFPSSLHTDDKSNNERLYITSGSGLAVTLAHLHETKDKSPISIIHSSREPKEFALLNRYIKNNHFNIKQAHFFDSSNHYCSKLRPRTESKVTMSRGRFNPADNAILHQFKGKIVFCGTEALGNTLEQTVNKKTQQTLLREKF